MLPYLLTIARLSPFFADTELFLCLCFYESATWRGSAAISGRALTVS